MKINNMFRDDINRKINGVVKVDQDAEDVIVQEVDEYVITRDLKKHFITFFQSYSESFDAPVSDIGVWISGFFGSGKSHFLKMLSYVLENKEIDGITTVERFRNKLENNQDIYDMMLQSTGNITDTILFNIDIVGPKNKNNTAVLQVFAKMFYNHCGYYGESLKVALMEQYLDSEGVYDEFKAAFERHKGKSWEEMRRAFAFNGASVKAALVETLGMSEADAQEWFSNKKDENYSIETLVQDIKAYVNKQPEGYRLMFMADEVGQYTGGDTSLLLNLQSIVEEIGSACEGKVWVICTGQEAIDEIIKARENEFSRIQARFKTRLSLTSSSVDEVIQERILKKKPIVEAPLKEVYANNEAVMRNLFTFSEAVQDIKGFGSENEFVKNFPFIPYQFIIMPKVFSEIRKHGNAGKHLSGGERSMLSGFQEAAQRIQEKNEFTLAPFYLFYDTVQTFLESAIRKVIDRAEKAADEGNGLEKGDVDLLKLLYMIRYVDDIPSNLDNLIIMMADDISLDKIVMREIVRNSLERLIREGYVSRSGDTYNFLTDEEQDIERDIRNTVVDTANIVSKIGEMIFSGIYANRKYRYEKYDFAFDQYVDQSAIVNGTGGVALRVLTAASYDVDRSKTKLLIDSKGTAIIVLADTPYYEDIERSMKIRKYVKQKNVSQLAKSVQDIIRHKQEDASSYDASAKESLKKALENAEFYIDGDVVKIGAGDAKAKIDATLKILIERVYSNLHMITSNYDSDMQLSNLAKGITSFMDGMEPNTEAMEKVSEFLLIQMKKNLPTSMADIQRRYQSVPYGWREIDIATVIIQLMLKQKADVKYAGELIAVDNSRLIDMLRKKTEVGKTTVVYHKSADEKKLRSVKELLTELFDLMDVPDDEKNLVQFIIERFSDKKKYYESLLAKYANHKYPDEKLLKSGIDIIDEILSHKKDNLALIESILESEEDLLDSKDDLQPLKDFFKTQVNLFDQASRFVEQMKTDEAYLSDIPEAVEAFCEIKSIIQIPTTGKYKYRDIPKLNTLISSVREIHENLLREKRDEIEDILRDCIRSVGEFDSEYESVKTKTEEKKRALQQKRELIQDYSCLSLLDGLAPQFWQMRDRALQELTELEIKEQGRETGQGGDPGVEKEPPKERVFKSYQRQAIFSGATLQTEEEIDQYVENIRVKLKEYLSSCDGIRIN